MESDGICTNLFTEEFLKTHYYDVRTVNYTKTPIHFPEAESIFESQNAVWCLALEGKIPQYYENRRNKV